jgi:DNA primase
MIPAAIIDEIRSKADVVKVISDYVKLRRRGKNYLGLCPFHSEKDPSFTVSPDKQMWHCFGCNLGGNVFSFLMQVENIGFAEAVAELGDRVGVAVPKPSGPSPSKGDKEKLYQIMQLAQKFFQAQLSGAEAKAYLQKRALTEKTIVQFGLGFALPGWDNLFLHLIARGGAPALIERSGLILARDDQSGYYDRFRNRLVFSISDPRGRVIAFGGRSLGNEEPKYLNSPDTAIYHKGETVYGLHLSKEQIKKNRTAVLVEGFFDLITPFQAGLENMVASLGTALTIAQCKLLTRYCDTVVVAYDADSAGGLAAERSVELLRAQGLKVRVAELSGGKDPDEIIHNQGVSVFKQLIDDALPYLEYKIKTIAARYNLREIESRSQALREIAALLSRESDSFVQAEYTKLAAVTLKVNPDALTAEINRASQARSQIKDSLRRIVAKPASKVEEAEKNLIALAVQNATVLARLKEELRPELFSLPPARSIAELLFTAKLSGAQDAAHFLLDNLPDEEAKLFLARLLVSDHLAAGVQAEAILADCLKVIKQSQTKGRIANLKQELLAAERSGEAGRAAEILAALKNEIY